MIHNTTELNKRTLRALAKCVWNHVPEHRKRKKHLFIMGIIYFILSLIFMIYSYLYYLYYQQLSGFHFYCGIIIFVGSIFLVWESKVGYELQLYRFYKKRSITKEGVISSVNYTFTEESILLEIGNNSSTFHWNTLDDFYEDENFFYFSWRKQYNIIDKSGFSDEDRQEFDILLKSIQIL